MKILFAGTPEMAVPALMRLNKTNNIVGVLTPPDKPSGRKRKPTPSPVKQAAMDLGLTVLQPNTLRTEARKEIAELQPDLLAVVAYGKIFGEKFLSLFSQGAINLHPSLLPRYRGPSPIPAAILAGDSKTGITIQRIGLEMDAGDILMQEEIPLTGKETTGSLEEYCGNMGAEMIGEVADLFAQGNPPKPISQNHSNASFCNLINKQDGLIDWNKDAVRLEREVRAYYPWPQSYTYFRGKKLAVLSADVYDAQETLSEVKQGTVIGIDKKQGILIQTGKGVLLTDRLQLQSKKPLYWKNFLNGVQDFVGETLQGA